MIGVICAMDIEIEGFRKIMENKKEETVTGINYTLGTLCGKDIVVAVCCDGKVNAAMCAQTMILKYGVGMIINTGVAGGIAEGLKACDIVIADTTCEHDMDLSPIGYEEGYTLGINSIFTQCDKNVVKLLDEAATELGLSHRVGVIATGDQFIASAEGAERLRSKFNATACEMEGGAIGHVCKRGNIPYGVLRAISDSGEDGAGLSFREFAEIAAKNSIAVMTKFAEKVEL